MATNSNARIAYKFWSDLNQFVSFTSESGNMLASNLQNHQPSSLWRSTTTAAQHFVMDFGGLKKVTFICLYNHNFSYNAVIKLHIGLDADVVNYYGLGEGGLGQTILGVPDNVYSYTFNAVKGFYAIGQGSLGIVRLGGYSDEAIYMPFSLFWLPDENVLGSYAKLSILDTTNPDGYIQCGRLLLGEHWSPDFNFEYGQSIKRVTNSKQLLMDNGATRASRLASYREMSLAFKNITYLESPIIDEMCNLVDLDKNVLISVYPGVGTTEEALNTMLAFFTEWSETTRDTLCQRSFNFKAREAK